MLNTVISNFYYMHSENIDTLQDQFVISLVHIQHQVIINDLFSKILVEYKIVSTL